MTLGDTIAQALAQWRAETVAAIGPVAFRAYAATNREQLTTAIERWARRRSVPRSPKDRVAANLAILDLLRDKQDNELTDKERRILDHYTGWGGLPTDALEQAGWSLDNVIATDEYYTPIEVADAIGQMLAPCLEALAGRDGSIPALDPAAGTGRLLRGLTTSTPINWTAVELSPVSSRILRLLHPEIRVYQQSFESWVTAHGDSYQGKLRLVVCNPPFSERGLAVDDQHPEYKEGAAYAYFLRRSLDLLAPGGLGVVVTPRSFMQAERTRELRRRVLARHHLVAAYRLPPRAFAGSDTVSDILLLRARGGELTELDSDDAFIVDGTYFAETPEHVLRSLKLPTVAERCPCAIGAPVSTDKSSPSFEPLEVASSLGYRLLRLRDLLADGSPIGHGLWVELRRDLDDFRTSDFLTARDGNANPWQWPALVSRAVDDEGADSYLNAFTRDGGLETWLESIGPPYRRYRGDPHNIVDQAAWLYRQAGQLNLEELVTLHQDVGGRLSAADIQDVLIGAGWNVAAHLAKGTLEPDRVYYSGDLWPKFDAARAQDDPTLASQAERLHRAIATVPIEDIDLSPRSGGWIPAKQLSAWVGLLTGDAVTLERRDGLIQLEGVELGDNATQPITDELRCLLAWINYDNRGFKPRKSPAVTVDTLDLSKLRDIDQHRARWAARWLSSWRSFATAHHGKRATLARAYNRAMRGLIRREYNSDPLTIPRWSSSVRVALRPHQIQAARRAIDNRQGLIALDTGLGKTFTGLAVLATARAHGWARRPVIVCPNALVWKWFDDIGKVLRDYRIAVIGTHRYRRHHGSEVDGLREQLERGEIDEQTFESSMVTSRIDTPAERADKWASFRAGGFDVAIMTPQALAKTVVSEEVVSSYTRDIDALARLAALGRSVPVDNGKPDALAWDFVDLLIIDEAADYKNLFPAPSWYGTSPKYAGGSAVSARAWQLHLRAYATRRCNSDGRGVVMLTATPMKNSPVELYNLLHIMQPAIWERAGIFNPEQFAERFLQIEPVDAIPDCELNIAAGPAVVGFRNLEELRAILGQVVEIKAAEDAPDLKLPHARKHIVEVDLDAAQAAKYRTYIEQLRKGDHGSAATMATQMRLALVAVHAALDDGFTWETAIGESAPNPNSPKFAAIAERIVASPDCGHIVFMEAKAGHRWLSQVLTDAGIAADRIGVMNSDVGTAAERNQIAADFNGADGNPRYDVIIANSVAYEGMDLQLRTCAIHHADLPWTPADLQQRNGRAYRQGNRCSTLEIYYYIARHSTDRYRLAAIDGKASWLSELLAGKSELHNPAGAVFADSGDLLIQLANDPESAKEVLEETKHGKRLRSDRDLDRWARSMVYRAAARYRAARETRDPHEALRMRGEADRLVEEIRSIGVDKWPWVRWVDAVQTSMPLIPSEGPFVYESLKVTRQRKRKVEAFNFGRVVYGEHEAIGCRRAGDHTWAKFEADDVAKLGISVDDMQGISNVPWPGNDLAEVVAAIKQSAYTLRSIPWPDWGWYMASSDFLDSVWPRVGHMISQHVRYFSVELPTVQGRKIELERGRDMGPVVPPTLAGWHRFLRLAVRSDLNRQTIEQVANYWWGRPVPEDL